MDNIEDKCERYLTIRINITACRNIKVDKIPSQFWRDAKAQVEKLLDHNVEQFEKKKSLSI